MHLVFMKRFINLIGIGFFIFALSLASQLVYAGIPHTPPFKIKARSAVLINAVSGQMIFEQNPDEIIQPASLSKLMTLYLVFEAIDNGYVSLSDQVRISNKAWKTGGSKMFLEVDTSVSLETLIEGIVVVSANDSCVAVAEYIAGVEEVFVEKMNKNASAIGMTNTVFKNSSGLPHDEQYTTARDMALLAYHYMRNHPEVLKFHNIKEMTFNKITQRNRNGLLWLDYGVDGLKTGWLSSAGFHIIATAYRDGDRFIAVVMGDKGETQRENTALKLLNYGFRNFKTIQVFPAEKPLAKVSIWKGTEGEASLGVSHAVFITIPRDDKGDVYIEKDFPEKIFAPVAKNHKVGQLRIIVDSKLLKTFPLVSLESIERAGFLKRIVHGIILFFILPPYWGTAIVLLSFIIFLFVYVVALKNRKRKMIFLI